MNGFTLFLFLTLPLFANEPPPEPALCKETLVDLRTIAYDLNGHLNNLALIRKQIDELSQTFLGLTRKSVNQMVGQNSMQPRRVETPKVDIFLSDHELHLLSMKAKIATSTYMTARLRRNKLTDQDVLIIREQLNRSLANYFVPPHKTLSMIKSVEDNLDIIDSVEVVVLTQALATIPGPVQPRVDVNGGIDVQNVDAIALLKQQIPLPLVMLPHKIYFRYSPSVSQPSFRTAILSFWATKGLFLESSDYDESHFFIRGFEFRVIYKQRMEFAADQGIRQLTTLSNISRLMDLLEEKKAQHRQELKKLFEQAKSGLQKLGVSIDPDISLENSCSRICEAIRKLRQP